MNKPFVFDLHEDEWQLWSEWGFPREAWTWGTALPPVVMAPGLPPIQSNRREIVIAGAYAERFRVWQVLRDWHPVYFDQVWQTYQATLEETAEPPDPKEQ